MSDIVDVKEATKQGHLNEVMNLFLEPSQSSLSNKQREKLSALYDIATEFEPGDPVGWIRDFDRSIQINFEIGEETTRLGKVLYMAQINVDQFRKQAKKSRGIGSVRRDF